MGSISKSPINEAANFLSRSNPSLLDSLRAKNPEIAEDLQQGMMAGDAEIDPAQHRRIVLAKARVMLVALEEAKNLCDRALPAAFAKINQGRKIRIAGQITTAIASSGTLSAIGAAQNRLALISGFLTLASALATILADYYDSVAGNGGSKTSDAYEQLVDARFKASSLLNVLRIQVELDDATLSVEGTISEGNGVCELINKTVSRIISGLQSAAPQSPLRLRA